MPLDEWARTPLIIIAILAVLGAVAGIGSAVWRIARWTQKVDGAVENWEEIKKQITKIEENITKIFQQLPAAAVTGSSPLRLTELGEKIADSLGAQEWASLLVPSLLAEVGDKEPFEIDSFCHNYTRTKLTDEWQRKIAQAAYEFGLEREEVQKVLAVVLRERLLGH